MDDSEDVKRIDEIIRKHKVEAKDPDEQEYAEFIDYTDCNEADADDIIIEIEDYEIPEFPKSDITQFHTYAPVHFLTDEEKSVVDSCPDPDLKQLLLLNRNKNIQLMQLYKKIKDLLAECQDNISTKQEFISSANNSKRVCNRIWRLGIPYFKSKDDFPCPRNEDIIEKHNNGELLFYDMTASNKWTEKDMNRLLKGISFHYKVLKETELEKTIKKYEKEIVEGVRDAEKEEIVQELKNDLEDLKNSQNDIYPPLGSDKNLDWNRIAVSFLNDRYSAQDCQIFWNTYLHPDINKGSWSREENDRLKKLATEYDFHNWDMIAAELGNNRTGFIACVHFFCKIDPLRPGRFTEAEDKLLCDLVTHYKQGEYIPWTKIAHHFKDRTRGQIFYRYKYFLSCRSGKSKGKFTEAEDILILVLVDRFGKKFTKCGQYFQNRSVVQIKARYSSNLKGAIKKGSFTIEEDKEILEYVRENGTTSWEPLVKRLNRCGGQIRQRNKTLTAYVKAHPGADLEKAPRRRFCGLSSDAEYDFLRCMADKFKHCEKIPTLQDIQKLMIKNPKPKAGPLGRLSRAPRELRVQREPEREEEEESENTPSESTITPPETNCKRKSEMSPSTDPSRTCNSDEIHSPPLQPEDGCDRDEPFSEVNLSVDSLLVDFFSNTLKLDFQQSVKRQHIQRAADTVVSVLTTLQAELSIPAAFEVDSRLDSIDVDILKNLTANRRMDKNKEYVIGRNGSDIEKLVPPNLYTLVGMRSLLIQNQIYKSRNARRAHIFEDFKTECKEKQVQWCINNHLSNQSHDIQNVLVSERNLFFKRFVSLFNFPAIMTLQKPSDFLESGSKTWREEHKGVRTYRMKKARPALTEGNTDATKFESIFIKQQPGDDASVSTSKAYIGRLDFHSKSGAASASNKDDPLKTNVDDSESDVAPKLSMVERLKRRINDTIDELYSSPPPKKFYKEVMNPVPFRSPLKKPTSYVADQTCSERENAKPRRTYVSRHKTKPTLAAAVNPGVNAITAIENDLSKNKSRLFAREKAVSIKTESLQDSRPDDAASRSCFNFSKGELVLENNSTYDSVTTSGSVNQDLLDLNVLNAVLKKERSVVEESFEF